MSGINCHHIWFCDRFPPLMVMGRGRCSVKNISDFPLDSGEIRDDLFCPEFLPHESQASVTSSSAYPRCAFGKYICNFLFMILWPMDIVTNSSAGLYFFWSNLYDLTELAQSRNNLHNAQSPPNSLSDCRLCFQCGLSPFNPRWKQFVLKAYWLLAIPTR